jgi:hypothetical protein
MIYFNIAISIATSGKKKVQPRADYAESGVPFTTNNPGQAAFSLHVAKTTLWCLPASLCLERKADIPMATIGLALSEYCPG